jgi:hypothetical protein
MAKRIIGFLVALLIIYLGYLGYQRYAGQNDSGEVHVDTTTSAAKDSSDSDSEPVSRPAIVYPPAQPAVQNTTVAAPATDSISPNPANGMAYAGSGKFQVYRQGNLTWRVDTASGHACILFATMEEWKKPIVYNNGCNNS